METVADVFLVNPPASFVSPNRDAMFGENSLPYALGVLKAGLAETGWRRCCIVDLNSVLSVTGALPGLPKEDCADLQEISTQWASSGEASMPTLPERLLAGLEELTIQSFKPGALVGFTILSENSLRVSCLLVQAIRSSQPSCTIVFGGPFICLSAGAQEESLGAILDIADYCCCQTDGIPSLRALIDMLSNPVEDCDMQSVPGIAFKRAGRIVRTQASGSRVEQEPPPNFSGLKLADYGERSGDTWLPYRFSRGCTQNCAFCTHRSLAKPEFKSIEKITKEISQLRSQYGISNFVFYDSAINNNTVLLDKFCDEFSQKGLNWKAYGITRGLSLERLQRSKQAGCIFISWGIENGSDVILESMGKPFSAKEALECVRMSTQAGIPCKTFLILAWPYEDLSQLLQTVDLAITLSRDYDCDTEAGPLKILRSSPIFEKPEEFGIRIIHDNNANPFARASILYEEEGGLDSDGVAMRRWIHAYLFRVLTSSVQKNILGGIKDCLALYENTRSTYDPKYDDMTSFSRRLAKIWYVILGMVLRLRRLRSSSTAQSSASAGSRSYSL